MKRVVAIAAVAGTLLSASFVRASKEYPGKLQEELDLPCAPQCTLCHDRPEGGLGHATKRFAAAMQVTGELGALEPEIIRSALEKLQGAECFYEFDSVPEPGPCNSDGDDLPDVEELKQGRDPNVAGEGLLCGPNYGCGARIEPRGRTDWTAAAVAAMAAFGLLLSRRRSLGPR